MSKPTELIRRAQAKHNELGTSELIDYYHDDGLIESRRCFISNHELKDADYGARRIETAFNQLELTQPPTEKDKIWYNEEEYRVVRWEQQLGFYNVFGEARRRHTGERMKHQSRGRGVR